MKWFNRELEGLSTLEVCDTHGMAVYVTFVSYSENVYGKKIIKLFILEVTNVVGCKFFIDYVTEG